MNRPFAKRFNMPRLSPAEAERQGRVTRLAIEQFADPATAINFLNAHHPALGGRPLDIAIADAEGLRAIESIILSGRLSG